MAIDISPEALAVAEANAADPWPGRPDRIPRSATGSRPSRARRRSTSILSNPPYIPTAVIPTLEPASATTSRTARSTAAPTACAWSPRSIAEAVPLLKPGGHLILEIGSDQEGPVRDLIAAQPVLKLAPTVRDHANHPRVVRATRV